MNAHEAVLRALELGLSTNRAAHAELRSFVAAFGPGMQSLRCAAVTALACAAGSDATEDFAELLYDPTRSVRECASDILYHVGDGRAWEIVFEQFSSEVRRRGPKRAPMPPAMPISYLLVQAESGSDGAVRLVAFLREEWKRLSAFERQWIGDHAAQIMSGSLDPAGVYLPSREDLARADAAQAVLARPLADRPRGDRAALAPVTAVTAGLARPGPV